MNDLPIIKGLKAASIAKKLFFVKAIMVVFIAIELFALLFAISSLSSIRAYVSGEGFWSKSQKNGVYYLSRYGTTHEEEDYQKFLYHLKVPLGDKKARMELEKTNPDYNIARKGFAEGLNHPDDIEGLINVFRRFRKIYYIDKAISIWAEADGEITKLINAGELMHREITSSSPSEAEIKKQLAAVTVLNGSLTQLENDFSYTLGEGSRWLEGLLLKVLLGIAFVIMFTGFFLLISVSRRIRKGINEVMRVAKKVTTGDYSDKAIVFSGDEIGVLAETFNRMTGQLQLQINHLSEANKKITEGEDRFFKAFDNNPIGMVITDADTKKYAFANKFFQRHFGFENDEVIGKTSAELQIINSRDEESLLKEFLEKGEINDRELLVNKKNGDTFWALTSIRMITLNDRKFALSSFYNISDRKKTEQEKKSGGIQQFKRSLPGKYEPRNKNAYECHYGVFRSVE